mmetsp:Transcript_7398/g.16238  ORF Transcript_7398/g.16238 Transcript_7398/m.16238 type:complete len:773 (-) Transcript_7398:59-2377(-)
MGPLVPVTTASAGHGASSGSIHGLSVPLPLFLSSRLSPDAVQSLHELIRGVPHLAKVADSDEVGVVHVLQNFEPDEIVALKNRRREAMGLPCVERFLRCPQVLSAVESLPVFDFILPGNLIVCCTGLTPAQRVICANYVQWMGGRMSEDITTAALLVALRVSLNSESKYQAALSKGIPIVGMSFLEKAWESKAMPQTTDHELLGLQGLRISLDPLDQELLEQCQHVARQNGAVIEACDKAEVLVIRDVMHPQYQLATANGMSKAPPAWLLHCCSSRRCVPIVGQFEVGAPRAVPLSTLLPGETMSAEETAQLGSSMHTVLMDAVLNLLYLTPEQRSVAQELAWQCCAYTTLDPADAAITHVIFKCSPRTVPVSVPVDPDRISFIDISWLQACAREGKWLKEGKYAHQQVLFNPSADAAAKEVRKWSESLDRPARALSRQGSELPPPVPIQAAPVADVLPLPAPEPPKSTPQASQVDSNAPFKLSSEHMPVPDMENCKVRITALNPTRDSQSTRARLEELAKLLGARVLDKGGKLSDITHWICVLPEAFEKEMLARARQKKQHVLTSQWLYDCYHNKRREPEHLYDIRTQSASGPVGKPREPQAEASTASAKMARVAGILQGRTILISRQALGTNKLLVQMVEELGGRASHLERPQDIEPLLLSLEHQGSNKVTVLLESEEARQVDEKLASLLQKLEQRGGRCVLPAWLAEMHAQWRLLPEDSFQAPLPGRNREEAAGTDGDPPTKRARVDEATFTWQTDAAQKLADLAKGMR